MTKLLDEAIAKIRSRPEADQDEAAEILFELAARPKTPVPIDDATRTAIREGQTQARQGKFASDEEIEQLFARP